MPQRTLIAACPPAPVDDLRVDQIAGAYLGADIYKRYLAQAGTRAYLVVGADEYQSQVEACAFRQRSDPDSMASQAREAIEASLRAYAIDADHFGQRDPGYVAHVQLFFSRLFRAGMIEVRAVPVLYEIKTGAYPIDAWVRGICPSCLDETCGGVCESCGEPNSSVELLGLDPHRYALRQEPRLVLDLERFRSDIERQLGRMRTQREGLSRLTRSLLERPLSPFVLSTKSRRGISTAFADLPDQGLHSVGEMYAGQLYFLQKVTGSLGAGDDYLQFVDFRDAYAHAFVQVALACAAQRCDIDWPAPSAVLTSQLQLTHPAGGVSSPIFARELTDVFNSDVVRAYLAMTGPEAHETCYLRSAFDHSLVRIAAAIETLVQHWNDQRHRPEAARSYGPPQDLIRSMRRRPSLEDWSSAELARRALNAVAYFGQRTAKARLGLTRYIPSVLALALEPFCPSYCDELRERFPTAADSWDELTLSPLDHDLPSFSLKSESAIILVDPTERSDADADEPETSIRQTIQVGLSGVV